jgi:hypothetical protein
LADLLVGQAGGGQQRDLAFLRRERVACRPIGAGIGLPGCPELAGRPAGPWPGAEAFEDLEGSSQMRPRFLPGPGASQPFAVKELYPGQVERKVVNAGEGASSREANKVVPSPVTGGRWVLRAAAGPKSRVVAALMTRSRNSTGPGRAGANTSGGLMRKP